MSCRVLYKTFKLPGGFAVHLTHEVMALNKSQRRKALVYCFLLSFLGFLGEVGKTLFAVCLAALLLFFLCSPSASAAQTTIPNAAHKYRATLTGVARGEFGLSAPIALLAAQIHQESRWNEHAVSPAGAEGLAQFMPATAKWLPTVAPHTGEPLPFNPAWAMRAMAAYDAYLLRKIKNTASARDHWKFALSAYNGGLGWVNRDRAKAARMGLDPSRYRDVEAVNAGRSAANFKENRGYPRRIFALQEVYAAAGWGAVVPREAAQDGLCPAQQDCGEVHDE